MNALNDVAVFVRVAETQSFVHASRSLSVTPSAISKAVTRLEARLGARLLNRSTRSLSLTDLGLQYFGRCSEALGQLEQADSQVSRHTGVAFGCLRLELPVTLGRHLLVGLLPEFLRQHPQLRLQVTLTDRLTDLVQERIDIAVRVGVLADSNLIARRVGKLPQTLCASPEFLTSHGVPLNPEDIRPEHCIPSLEDGKGHIRQWTFSRQGVQHKLVPAGRLAFHDESAAIAAAVHGGGFVQACGIGVEAHIAAGLLRPVLSDWTEDSDEPVYLVYPRHRQSSAQIRAFTQFAIDCFRRGSSR